MSPIFTCCYCAEELSDEDGSAWVGVSIYNKDTGDLKQAWFCHEGCFRERLDPDYNVFPEEGAYSVDEPYEVEKWYDG